MTAAEGDVIMMEAKCTITATRLNHPKSSLPVRGRTVFQETGPWCQKGWGELMISFSLQEVLRQIRS